MSTDCAPVHLDAVDATELAELLEFFVGWLDSQPGLDADGFGVEELRADLARFAFLLGGDGDRLAPGGAS